MSFEDHFSQRAQEYARYRPSYPPELFAYLASLCSHHQLAWDCGTGNGQAALGLTGQFDRIVATDASAEQLAHAFPHARIEYRAAPAEDVNLDSGSVDLVTAALAVHWFHFEPFYREVTRVARAGGILAVWTYHLAVIEPRIDQVLAEYYSEVLAGYWPERIRYVDECYRTLPFPFEELRAPNFEMQAHWDLYQLLGFLDSWSATRRYEAERGQNPLQVIWQTLAEAWGEAEQVRDIRWPLYLRVGKVK